ncbi:GNAT family N-acetyltransferase [Chitinophaga flava]|uniref:GNAT family N-acetyltransferase n=1 Tax=Chitinophaga flava TaxID=2259036 RepID=A0A365XVI9_9BACT|nr:GNAT family N-acetyltransferase [Chitinophaga flava]RBL89605.1 GNAT family N-acetyltransferase [Chitinophaga flava]
MMNLRKATISDMPELRDLYQQTIRTVNSRDYNALQIAAWSGRGDRLSSLENKINTQHFFIAETPDKVITGLASLEDDGEFDMMFVHKDYQRQGIATLLANHIIQTAKELGIPLLTAYVSITARLFFEKIRFRVVQEQSVNIDGVELTNYQMVRAIQ